MGLIDANKYRNILCNWLSECRRNMSTGDYDIDADVIASCIAELDEQPVVDAVEVVRCKDCIYWGLGICNLFSEEPDCRYSGHYVYTDPEAFCSYGEKAGV